MKRQIIVTNYKNKRLTLLYEEDSMQTISVDSIQSILSVGDIYIGKVKNIVPNINAAFVEIGKGLMGYYPINENPNHLFLNTKKNNKLVAGDEILVQINKENLKTKEYGLTSQLQFSGHYLILYAARDDVRISSRIKDEEKREGLIRLVREKGAGFGYMIRTEAQYASEEALISEMSRLMVDCNQIMSTAKHRTCFSKMRSGDTLYESMLKKYESDYHLKFTTDIPDVYEAVKARKESYPDLCHFDLSFYKDETYSLLKLKNIEAHIDKLRDKRVWLKSGGYLVIEPTEALTVIDVNTGKAIGKNDSENNFMKINLEAAEEIARQIRLRNISGIIIIDFINMKKNENNTQLMQALRKAVNRDPIQTTVVDRTALSLVEMTRKKERRSLREQLADLS